MYKRSVSLAVLALALGNHAIAQETSNNSDPDIVQEDDDKVTLDEIIVQGTKLGLSVQDSDVSVEVFDAVRIERESLFDLDDLLLRTPNVAINGGTTSLTIRGINRTGLNGGGQGVTSNVYVDGAPVSTIGLQFGVESIWDVAQIEVLRGPQSTVQGRNALAGAIVISTADPTYEWEAKARARYAEFGTQQYAGAISGPIIPDQLAFRVAVDYQSFDGITDNLLSGEPLDQDFSNAILVRSKLLAEPNFLPDFRGEFIFEYINSDLGLFSAVQNAPVGITDEAFLDFDPNDGFSFADFQQNETEVFRGVIDLGYDVTDNIGVKWLTTFEQALRFRELGELDDLSIFPNNGFNNDFVQTYSTELSVNFNFDKFSGNIGGYYFESLEDFLFDVNANFIDAIPSGLGITLDPPDTTVSALTLDDTRTENFAAYFQGRYEFNEYWTVSFGLRYDNEQFSTSGTSTSTSLDPIDCLLSAPGFALGLPAIPVITIPCVSVLPPDEPAEPQSDRFDAFLPRGSITYNFTDDISTFFAVQRGYRAGGTFVQLTNTDALAEIVLGTFDPEFLTNFEVGWRSQFFDRKLTVNGGVFFSILDDQQVSIAGPSGGPADFTTENIGESRIFGVEISADYQATDELNLYGSLGALRSEIIDFPFISETAIAEDPSLADNQFANLGGNETPLSPNITFTVGGSYNHQSGVFADASLNFVGPVQTGVDNLSAEDFLDPTIPGSIADVVADPELALLLAQDESVGSRATVNLRLGYRHENFTIAAFATNLFNDDTLLSQGFANINRETGGLNIFSEPNFTRQAPQTFGIQVDVNF